MSKRRKYYWALSGCWHGSVCAIQHGEYVPPFARWRQVPASEWRELRKEGFYTRRSNSRPVALLSPDDRNEQRSEPFDWRIEEPQA